MHRNLSKVGWLRWGSVILGATLVLAACSSASTSAPPTSPPASASAAPASAVPSASGATGCVPAPTGLVTPGTLTIGVDLSGPPLHFVTPSNQPTGFDVDLAQALAAQMCLHVQYMNQSFAGLLPSLNANKFDALISGVGITPQRAQAFSFIPYFLAGVQLVAASGSHLSFQSSSQLCGHSVATTAGSVEIADLQAQSKACPAGKAINILTYPTFTEALEQLHKGTAQLAYVDWPVAAYAVAQSNGTLSLASPVLTGAAGPRHRDGIAMRLNDTPMISAFTAALTRVEQNGTYASLLAKYHLQAGNILTAGG